MSKQDICDEVSEFTQKKVDLRNLIDTIETCRKWKDIINVVVKIRCLYESTKIILECEADDKIRESHVADLAELFYDAESKLRDVMWNRFGISFVDTEQLSAEVSRIVRVRSVISGMALLGVVLGLGSGFWGWHMHAMGSILEKIFAVYAPVAGIFAGTYLGIKYYINSVERSRINCNGIEHFIFRPTKKMRDFGHEFGRLADEIAYIKNYTAFINLAELTDSGEPASPRKPLYTYEFTDREARQGPAGPAYTRNTDGSYKVPKSAIRIR